MRKSVLVMTVVAALAGGLGAVHSSLHSSSRIRASNRAPWCTSLRPNNTTRRASVISRIVSQSILEVAEGGSLLNADRSFGHLRVSSQILGFQLLSRLTDLACCWLRNPGLGAARDNSRDSFGTCASTSEELIQLVQPFVAP